MNEAKAKAYLQEIAEEGISEAVDLWPAVQQQVVVGRYENRIEPPQRLQRSIEIRSLSVTRRGIKRLTFALPVTILLIIAILFAFFGADKVLATLFKFIVEDTETLDRAIIDVAAMHNYDTSLDEGYEVVIIDIPQDRQEVLRHGGIRIPQPGEVIKIDEGRFLPVPAVLPDGFEWQAFSVAGQSMIKEYGFGSVAGQRAGGGGKKPVPAYDPSFAVYLIGGDSSDRLLLLAQFDPHLTDNFMIRTFSIIASTSTSTNHNEYVGEGTDPTPTPVSQYDEGKSQVGYIIQAGGENQRRLVILAQNIQETSIKGVPALWYQGTWTLKGEWLVDPNILTLTWERGGYVYQLTGQSQTLAQLIEIAASIP